MRHTVLRFFFMLSRIPNDILCSKTKILFLGYPEKLRLFQLNQKRICSKSMYALLKILKKTNSLYQPKNDIAFRNCISMIHHSRYYVEEKTFQRISNRYFWTSIRSYIPEYLKKCPYCSRCRTNNRR